MQKLLIVEDDQSVRNTMVLCLELEGYTVDAVASTGEAIDRLRLQAYPIVISDIYLDERTGLDVLRTARQQNPDSCRTGRWFLRRRGKRQSQSGWQLWLANLPWSSPRN
jgi:CheY-like chemotaxis protein